MVSVPPSHPRPHLLSSSEGLLSLGLPVPRPQRSRPVEAKAPGAWLTWPGAGGWAEGPPPVLLARLWGAESVSAGLGAVPGGAVPTGCVGSSLHTC